MNIAGSFDENGAGGNIGYAVRVNGTDVFNGTTTREDGFGRCGTGIVETELAVDRVDDI